MKKYIARAACSSACSAACCRRKASSDTRSALGCCSSAAPTMALRAAPDAELLDLVEYMLSLLVLRFTVEGKNNLDMLFMTPGRDADAVVVADDDDAWLGPLELELWLWFPAAAAEADEE